MKRNIYFSLTLITSIYSVCLRAEEGNELLYVSSALLIIDWKQTIDIKRNNKFKESNIILGKRPSYHSIDAYFISALTYNYILHESLSKNSKYIYSGIVISIEVWSVSRNFNAGLSYYF